MDFWQIEFYIIVLSFLLIFNVIKHFYFRRKHKLLILELQETEYQISKNAEVALFFSTEWNARSYSIPADLIFIKNNIFILQKHFLSKQICGPIMLVANDIFNFRSENVSKVFFYKEAYLTNNYMRIQSSKESIYKTNIVVEIRLKDNLALENYDLSPKY